MSRIARIVLVSAGTVVLVFAAGNLCGFYFYPRLFPGTDEHGEAIHDEPAAADPPEEEHLALTKQAFENLALRLGQVERGDHAKSLALPGEVVEIRGKSDLSISVPVSGIVERVLVLEGQALGPSDRLFTLRIIDDNLVKSQSELLATLSRREVVRKEVARLAPLTEAGTVSGRRLLDFEYELSQLESTRATLRQEILARGLPKKMLRDLVESKSLATELTISLPTFMETTTRVATRPVSLLDPGRIRNFSIEELRVHPGKTVHRGDDLCDLAYHAELHVRGQAFESDMPILARIAEKEWTVGVEFGHEHRERHSHSFLLEGLELLHVDNHVDRRTQTFSFYLPLRNEVERSITDAHGRVFQQWKYKPGQRVHLRVPTEKWQNALLLPADAVVVEGPNAYVFAEHIEPKLEGDHAEDPEHHHDEVFLELEPVPVRLLHRDERLAVIADDGQVPAEQRVALNCGYKLHLAMKMQTAGGGGGHHHHDH